MSAEALEELRQVLKQVDAGDPLQRREQHAPGTAEHLHTQPSRFQEELQRATFDEPRHPLGRVDEVERVAGGRRVEHQQVVARLLVQLVELLHRHVLLRAGHRVGDLLVDAVLRGSGRASPRRARGAPRDRRRCASRRASSPTARPSSRSRVRAKRSGSTQPLLVAQLGQAEGVRQPLGGVDREHRDLRPCAAIPIAIAAEVVVLPTPPEPAQMQICLVRRGARRTSNSCPSSIMSASSSTASMSSCGRNRNGSSTGSCPDSVARRSSCIALRGCAAVLGYRGTQGRAARHAQPVAVAACVLLGAARAAFAASSSGTAAGRGPFMITVQWQAELLLQVSLQVESR